MGILFDWLRRRRRLLIAALLLVLGSLALWRVRGILLPFALAIVMAYLLSPLAKALTRRGVPRVLALALVYVVVVVAGAVAIGLLVPTVVLELTRMAEFLPGYLTWLQELALSYQEQYSEVQIPLTVRQAIDDAVQSIQNALLAYIGRAAQAILGVFGALFSFIVAPILSFYMLKDLEGLRAGLARFVPVKDREPVFRLLSEVDGVMVGFVRGQLIVAGIVGVLMAGALTFLGVKFAVVLGVIAGLTNIIPYFGPFLGSLPVLAVAAAGSTGDLLRVLIAIIIIQQIESQLLAPRIISKHVRLHPLAVVFALMVGLELYGVLGMLLAVPIAGIIRVVLDHWLASRTAAAGDPGAADAVPATAQAEAG